MAEERLRNKGHVVYSVRLLISGKVRRLGRLAYVLVRLSTTNLSQLMNVQVPLFFKEIIDTLNIPLDAKSAVWVVCRSVILACTPRHLPSA